MSKYRIIGNMTGNSMDAIDLVLTEFDGDLMTDICAYSSPYSKDMQEKIENLRKWVFNKNASDIEKSSQFKEVHNEYIRQIADCINEMCEINGIDKATIDAIGFHGKTLDHNPPSKAHKEGSDAYTLQIGSGEMLADLTQIPVVYDFRSDALMAGFDGAPLVGPHNAHIAAIEGDGCYYNGGNTSNFALIINGKAQISSDSGPFNEYTDSYIRLHSDMSFDKDGAIGKTGKLDKELLAKIFAIGRSFYETLLPKSGDPAYYHKNEIFQYTQQQGIKFADAVHTFEYAAAYIAVQALTLVPKDVPMPDNIILFGGGWKNPFVLQSFNDLLSGNGYILAEHRAQFANLLQRFRQKPKVRISRFGKYMEARLFADLARYRLENKPWEIPEIAQAGQKIVCGLVAAPVKGRNKYTDCLSRAAKGWQKQYNFIFK